MMDKFWLWLCRFAYKRLSAPHLTKDGKLPVGIPGMRDPENKCELYSPGKRMKYPECQGDGHYLCHGCRLFDPSGLD